MQVAPISYVDTIEGSVKSIYCFISPLTIKTGLADFYFKNVYSVFDWGEMPMEEGAFADNSTLMILSAFFFEMLQKEGLPTHYHGLVLENGDVVNLDHCIKTGEMPVAMRVKLVNKLPVKFDEETGEYDYSAYQNPEANNYIVPIEFIYREEGPLPEGSSFTDRMERGKIDPTDYGLLPTYQAGDDLPNRINDWSTKFEKSDDYQKPKELRQKANLNEGEWFICNQLVLRGSWIIFDYLQKNTNMRDLDGKFELLKIGNGFHIGDVVGADHEVRRIVLPHGKLEQTVKISKQSRRDLHKKLDTRWYAEVETAKERADKEKVSDWKQFVTRDPKPLPAIFFEVDNNLRRAGANQILEKKFYSQATELDEAAVEFAKYMKQFEN